MSVQLVDLRDSPLSVDECLDAVRRIDAGGVVVFAGSVRDHDSGRTVQGLEYSAHPTALDELRRVADDVAARWPGCALAAVHRVGTLQLGDIAVVVAASAPHRPEAFAAARELIDELKDRVPIWKHQRYEDGTTEWVGSGEVSVTPPG